MTDGVEFISFDRADELEVDGCRIEGADREGERLRLGGDTFKVVVGFEGPGVLDRGNVSAETPFTAGLRGKLSFLERFLARSAYEGGVGVVVDGWG